MSRSETLSQLLFNHVFFNCYLFITDRSSVEEHTRHRTGQDRSEQFRAVEDPLRDSVEVSVIKCNQVYTNLFNNSVPRRCHNGWNWFWRS